MIVYNNETRSFGIGQTLTNWGKKNTTALATSGISTAVGAYIGRKRAQRRALNAGFEKGSAEYNRMVRRGTIGGGAVGAVGGYALGNRLDVAHKASNRYLDAIKQKHGGVSYADRFKAARIGVNRSATLRDLRKGPSTSGPNWFTKKWDSVTGWLNKRR